MTTQTRPHGGEDCWCGPEWVQPNINLEGDPRQYALGLRHHYEGHQCKCPNCLPAAFNISDDLPLDSTATWTVNDIRIPGVWPAEVAIDGHVRPYARAIKEGADGFIIRYSDYLGDEGPHVCQSCFEAGCQEVERGNVIVTKRADEQWLREHSDTNGGDVEAQ